MKIRNAVTRRGVEGGGAVGFLCGVACTLLLVWWHHRHSMVFFVDAESRTLPGTDPSNDGEAAADVAQVQEPPVPRAMRAAPLPDLDTVPHLMVSFGNAAYFELAQNWAKTVQQIGSPFLIAALDEGMMALCLENQLPCSKIDLGKDEAHINFRDNFQAFRAMGAVKVRFVLDLLEQHPALPLVVVSDTDAVWLRPPWTYFQQRPAAEFFSSSDCLSHQVEVEWRRDHGQPRCGHVPGNGDGHALNTGLFAVRNTEGAKAAMRAWAGMLVDPAQERADDPMHREMDDQLALNTMFEGQGGSVSLSAEDPRTVLVWDNKLRLQVLPVLLFSNGHVAFVQRTPWKMGVAPIAIHTTFQRYHIPGKRSRLREFGLWLMDPPEYYGAPAPAGALGGAGAGAQPLQLLAYELDVAAFVAEAERRRYPGARMPLFEKNWLGMSFQLAALRDALAAARMLGRTLIVPPVWCWCDYDEHPHILYRCRIKGTDYGVPFEAPLDYLIPVAQLDAYGVAYRHSSFLQHPQVPASLRHSRAAVDISPSRPANPFPAPAVTIGHGATVWAGIQLPDLLRVLQPVQSSAVLVLRGHVPGFLGGYGPQGGAEAAQMDELFAELLGNDGAFCCFSWGDSDQQYDRLRYAWPAPLAEEWRPWEPPVLRLPEWCDRVSAKHGNQGFTRLRQHPCAFLRNASLAAEAADDSGPYNTGWEPH